MSGFIKLLDQVIQYGEVPFIDSSHSIIVLKKVISKLYLEYLNLLDNDYGIEDYHRKPQFNFHDIRKVVIKNFPQFDHGHYGYSVDDITNLILFAKITRWRFDNVGEKDAQAFFKNIMHVSGEEKVVDVLKFLSDQ